MDWNRGLGLGIGDWDSYLGVGIEDLDFGIGDLDWGM